MTGRVDVRFDMPEAVYVKQRFTHPDGRDFTRSLRIAMETTVINILNKNNHLVRLMVEKEIKAQGFVLKKPHYQRDLEAYMRKMLRTKFWPKKTKGTIPPEELQQ